MPPNNGSLRDQENIGSRADNSRNVKRGIRSVKEQVRGEGDDLADPNSEALVRHLSHLNELQKQVLRPSEQADDSEVFFLLTQKGAEMAKRVAAGKGRTVNDFMRHLKVAYVEGLDAQQEGEVDPRAFNWNRLSQRASKYFRYTPGVSCLLGPLDAAPKQKKAATQRAIRKPVGAAVAPELLEVEDTDAKEKRETDRSMEIMWKALSKHPNGVGFLEVVMNMQSFAQLCENCFTLSFLVHTKRVRMSTSDNNNSKGMLVFPFNEKAHQRDNNNTEPPADRSQFILGYDMADWKDWQRYVKPEDCLMPHREEHADDAPAIFEAEDEADDDQGGGDSQGDEDGDEDGEEEAGPSNPKKRRSQGLTGSPAKKADVKSIRPVKPQGHQDPSRTSGVSKKVARKSSGGRRSK